MNEEQKLYCKSGKLCQSKKEAQTSVNLARRPHNAFSRRHGTYAHIGRYSKKMPLRIYQCELCGYWHTTSALRRKEIRNVYDN